MTKRRARYFDSGGREISEHDALDGNVLRSGISLRVPMWMADAARRQPGDACVTEYGHEGRLRQNSGQLTCVQITDGRSNDPMALHRPGFRIPTVNDRRAVHDAYTKADKQAGNRWKCQDNETLCSDCDGEGYDEDGNECKTCHGEGVVKDKSGFGSTNEGGYKGGSSDGRTVDRDQAYRDYDADLANAWRDR